MKFNWGHGIFIFMTVFVLLTIFFIIFSLNQSQDLVADDYYDKGADYSEQIEINKRSDIYQDSIIIQNNTSSIDIEISQSLVSFKDTLLIHFYRPSDKKSDFKLKFPMLEIISIPVAGLKKGRYEVKLMWSKLGDLYNLEKEINIE